MLGTPIGNLEDLSARALRILREVDAIVSEDTRTTLKLLRRHEIRKTTIAWFQHSPPGRLREILDRLARGQSLALVTEAGTPGVSDPGATLVKAAHQAGIPVVAIPGPSAVTTAASVSGFPADAFHFAGFLPRRRGRRRKALEAVAALEITLIFFESPHRVAATLQEMHEVLGNRRLAVCRELTKMHEEVWRTTVGDALKRYRGESPRGEFTLVVEGSAADLDPDQGADVDL